MELWGGRFGQMAVTRRRAAAAPAPDFTVSSTMVVTAWGTVAIGNLVPLNAPADAAFQLVGEPAGLAVVNG